LLRGGLDFFFAPPASSHAVSSKKRPAVDADQWTFSGSWLFPFAKYKKYAPRPGPGCASKEIAMNVERILRGVAGFFILLSLALSQLHSPYWLLFTAFVGVNLFQSFLTNWCPLMTILRKAGVQG
jgi:hypothetical protein